MNAEQIAQDFHRRENPLAMGDLTFSAKDRAFLAVHDHVLARLDALGRIPKKLELAQPRFDAE